MHRTEKSTRRNWELIANTMEIKFRVTFFTRKYKNYEQTSEEKTFLYGNSVTVRNFVFHMWAIFLQLDEWSNPNWRKYGDRFFPQNCDDTFFKIHKVKLDFFMERRTFMDVQQWKEIRDWFSSWFKILIFSFMPWSRHTRVQVSRW